MKRDPPSPQMGLLPASDSSAVASAMAFGSPPVVMVFEDMQWADASLLDFIEYLLEWSRNSPLFVMTLARPELLDRRPTWGAASRNLTSIYLEPLPEPAMKEMLDVHCPD
jgi:predicted ATPase